MNHGLFRSAASPNPARASSKAASSRNARRGAGSASTTAAHRSSGLAIASSSPGASAKTATIAGSSARPDQRATVCSRDIAAADGVEHHRRIADGREPGRLSDLRASPAGRDAEAIETLEAVQDRAPDRLRQPQASRQVRADLTVGPRPLRLQLRHARRAAQRPQAHRVYAQARQELHRLARLGRIDQVSPGADHDVIAAEHGGDLVRRRGTAGEPHQRPVVHLALTALIEPRPPGQFRRQQARAHRLARRMPASQVAHHRQRRDHARHADRVPHDRKSKDQQATSPRNRQQVTRTPTRATAGYAPIAAPMTP